MSYIPFYKRLCYLNKFCCGKLFSSCVLCRMIHVFCSKVEYGKRSSKDNVSNHLFNHTNAMLFTSNVSVIWTFFTGSQSWCPKLTLSLSIKTRLLWPWSYKYLIFWKLYFHWFFNSLLILTKPFVGKIFVIVWNLFFNFTFLQSYTWDRRLFLEIIFDMW